jgi:hypothetical protein
MFLSLAAIAQGEPLLPTAPGTTWEYRAVEETEVSPVLTTDRIDGREKAGEKELFKLVRRRGGEALQTDFIAVDDQGIFVSARLAKGRTIAVDPPQPLVALPLRVGTKWSAGATGAVCEIISEEDVGIAAGKFHAYRIRCTRSAPVSSATDRWFTPGVGFIKELSTTRAPTGDLLERTSLELQKPPTVVAMPEPTPVTEVIPKRLLVDLASMPEGEAVTSFSSSVPRIHARWNGRGLRPPAKVRTVWIAEEVDGIAPPDYKVDEASTIATEPSSRGIFTLSRPEAGWAEGKYRAEFYLDETFIEAVKVNIGK